MKRSPTAWLMFAVIVLLSAYVAVRAQQPSPVPLNPVASARIIEIETEIAHLRQSERDVLDGAGIPEGWQCNWNAQKVVTCHAPEPKAGPKQ